MMVKRTQQLKAAHRTECMLITCRLCRIASGLGARCHNLPRLSCHPSRARWHIPSSAHKYVWTAQHLRRYPMILDISVLRHALTGVAIRSHVLVNFCGSHLFCCINLAGNRQFVPAAYIEKRRLYARQKSNRALVHAYRIRHIRRRDIFLVPDSRRRTNVWPSGKMYNPMSERLLTRFVSANYLRHRRLFRSAGRPSLHNLLLVFILIHKQDVVFPFFNHRAKT